MIKVLVVDDSLFMRSLISNMLNSDPWIEVIDTAKNGFEAIKKLHELKELKPDVITLDLIMPGMGGLAALRRIMSEYPTPVIVLSAYSKEDADITIKCLDAGAVSFIIKPSGELSLDIEKIKSRLLKEVKTASQVNIGKIKTLAARKIAKGQRPEGQRPEPKRGLAIREKIVVIGASTGGPQTLEALLSCLPTEFPATIFVVQHMPSKLFIESLVRRLNKSCELEIKVAENNEVVREGRIYFARPGFFMKVEVSGKGNSAPFISLVIDKSGNSSPSIDATMISVADLYKEKAVGVILTGMGHDGVKGAKAIKEHGGRIIVQDESSLIFGMPKAVFESGYADEMLSVSGIADAIIDSASE